MRVGHRFGGWCAQEGGEGGARANSCVWATDSVAGVRENPGAPAPRGAPAPHGPAYPLAIPCWPRRSVHLNGAAGSVAVDLRLIVCRRRNCTSNDDAVAFTRP